MGMKSAAVDLSTGAADCGSTENTGLFEILHLAKELRQILDPNLSLCISFGEKVKQ